MSRIISNLCNKIRKIVYKFLHNENALKFARNMLKCVYESIFNKRFASFGALQ